MPWFYFACVDVLLERAGVAVEAIRKKIGEGASRAVIILDGISNAAN
jgi:hypothetical protein